MIEEIPIENLEVSEQNIRKELIEPIDELADSIKELGLLQPIVVRPNNNGKYEIIVGQRRYLACKKLGWKKIPAMIQSADDRTAMKKSLVENIQRSDISPIEKAKTFQKLCEGRTQTEVAKELGISPSTISSTLLLLDLHPELQKKLDEMERGSHTEAMKRIARDYSDPEIQLKVSKDIETLTQKEALHVLEKADGDSEKVLPIAQDIASRGLRMHVCYGDWEECPFIPEEIKNKIGK
jgi:ParB family chromosome partitioning protein